MNEQIRAEFEQDFTSRYTAHKLGRMMTMGGDLADEYKDPRVNYCWVLWQAAHEMYAPRWISVEDRLPEAGAQVLISNSEGLEMAEYSLGEEDGIDSMGWDAGFIGSLAFPARTFGADSHKCEARFQPTHWALIEGPQLGDKE